jgi:hypothetical protein
MAPFQASVLTKAYAQQQASPTLHISLIHRPPAIEIIGLDTALGELIIAAD